MNALAWLPAAARAAGLDLIEVDGWEHRGRPGTFAPRGVVFHHTAGARTGDAPSLAWIRDGSPIAPLSQFLVGRDLGVRLVAGGRCNHAGVGGPWRTVPTNSGNSYLVGIEYEHSGRDDEPWDVGMLDVAEVLHAVLLTGLGADTSMLLGHKEWSPGRKVDPARIDMDVHRGAVERRIREGRVHLGGSVPGPVVPVAGMGEYPVRKGDTLARIADHAYSDPGAWPTILHANPRTLAGSTVLAPGMTLWLPSEPTHFDRPETPAPAPEPPAPAPAPEPAPTPEPEDPAMLIDRYYHGQGDDAMTAHAAAVRNGGAFLPHTEPARALIDAGARVIVVGGPAVRELAPWAGQGAPVTDGAVTACFGANFAESAAMAYATR